MDLIAPTILPVFSLSLSLILILILFQPWYFLLLRKEDFTWTLRPTVNERRKR